METAVVVQCSAPEHRAVRHHAAGDVFGFELVTRPATAGPGDDTQITRIDKTHVLPTFTRQKGVGPFRICPGRATVAQPFIGKARLYMSVAFDALNLPRIL